MVVDIQAARQHGVAGQQEAGPRVVDRDRGAVMTGAAGDLQYPAAEVEGHDLRGPVVEPEELLHGLDLAGDDCGVGSPFELPVGGDMIAVPVRCATTSSYRSRG